MLEFFFMSLLFLSLLRVVMGYVKFLDIIWSVSGMLMMIFFLVGFLEVFMLIK